MFITVTPNSLPTGGPPHKESQGETDRGQPVKSITKPTHFPTTPLVSTVKPLRPYCSIITEHTVLTLVFFGPYLFSLLLCSKFPLNDLI